MNKHLFVGLMVVAACGVDNAEPEHVDGEHDRYVGDGKTDTGGIQEGTDEAYGVLYVANTLSELQLRTAVGLPTNAAANIAAYRRGDDNTVGTTDDEEFETLAELDSIPFIGPIAFGKLLTYADAEGFTDDPPVVGGGGTSNDPFDPTACAGAAMSHAAAHARWQTNPVLGDYQLVVRHKVCGTGPNSTCDWVPVPSSDLSWRLQSDGQVMLHEEAGEVSLQLVHGMCDRYGDTTPPIAQFVDGAECTALGQGIECGTYRLPGECRASYADYTYDLPNGWEFALRGKVTENCVQLRDQKGLDPYEVAILVRF